LIEIERQTEITFTKVQTTVNGKYHGYRISVYLHRGKSRSCRSFLYTMIVLAQLFAIPANRTYSELAQARVRKIKSSPNRSVFRRLSSLRWFDKFIVLEVFVKIQCNIIIYENFIVDNIFRHYNITKYKKHYSYYSHDFPYKIITDYLVSYCIDIRFTPEPLSWLFRNQIRI